MNSIYPVFIIGHDTPTLVDRCSEARYDPTQQNYRIFLSPISQIQTPYEPIGTMQDL